MTDVPERLINIVRRLLTEPSLLIALTKPGTPQQLRALEALDAGELSAEEVRQVLVALRGERPDTLTKPEDGASVDPLDHTSGV